MLAEEENGCFLLLWKTLPWQFESSFIFRQLVSACFARRWLHTTIYTYRRIQSRITCRYVVGKQRMELQEKQGDEMEDSGKVITT